MKVEVGKVLKPQGIKGELKVMPYIDFEKFKDLEVLTINNKEYKIKNAVFRLGYIYLTLEGIEDRNQALLLHSQSILAEGEEIALEEGEFFVQDLIGMDVYVEDENYGKVIAIDQFGSADVITIQGSFGKWQFPYLTDVVVELDVANKKMVLDKKRFEEVRVWE